MSVDVLFKIAHAAVANLDGVIFLLNMLCKIWSAGNSSSKIFKTVWPILVATFLLNGGLYQIIFRFRLLELMVFWDVDSEVVGISIYVDNRSLLGLLGTMALHAKTSLHQMEFQKVFCCSGCYWSITERKNRLAINLQTCKLVANSLKTNFAINLRMKCFRFATTKFTSNLQAALHNLQIYM